MVLNGLPRRGQLASLVCQAPVIRIGDDQLSGAPAAFLPRLVGGQGDGQGTASAAKRAQSQQSVQGVPKVLILQTERLILENTALDELRLLNTACTVVITGNMNVHRPGVEERGRSAGANQLRAMVDSMMRSGVGLHAALLS